MQMECKSWEIDIDNDFVWVLCPNVRVHLEQMMTHYEDRSAPYNVREWTREQGFELGKAVLGNKYNPEVLIPLLKSPAMRAQDIDVLKNVIRHGRLASAWEAMYVRQA